MFELSESDIWELLYEYIGTSEGQADVENFLNSIGQGIGVGGGSGGGLGSGSLDDKEINSILADIKRAFAAAVTAVIPSFHIGSIHTTKSGYGADGQLNASLVVDESALHRESLRRNKNQPPNTGVEDILALFTHGYTIRKKRRFGYWHSHDDVRIGAKKRRSPNDFLSKFVDDMNSKYLGKCVVTLEDTYKRK